MPRLYLILAESAQPLYFALHLPLLCLPALLLLRLLALQVVQRVTAQTARSGAEGGGAQHLLARGPDRTGVGGGPRRGAASELARDAVGMRPAANGAATVGVLLLLLVVQLLGFEPRDFLPQRLQQLVVCARLVQHHLQTLIRSKMT